MKKAFCFAASLFFAPLSSASDFTLTFDMATSFPILGTEVDKLLLDITFTERFIAANGVFEGANDLVVPTTGTCVITGAGGVTCNFQARLNSLDMELDSDLNGVMRINAPGGTFFSTSVTLSEIEETE